MKKLVCLVTFLVALSGCAYAKTTSYVATAKDFHPETKYKNVLVIISAPDNETKVIVEDMFLKLVEPSETKFLASHDIYSPLDSVDETIKKANDLFKNHNIDAGLYTVYGGMNTTTSSFIMPIADVQHNSLSGSVGNQPVHLSGNSYGTQYVPISSSMTHVSNEAYLRDIKTQKDIWYSELSTSGETKTAIIKSYVNKLYKDLYDSGLLDLALIK